MLFATAFALFLSAVNVYLRDIQYLVEIVVMIGFWLSPIVYAWSQVTTEVKVGWVQELYLANPMTLVTMGFQRAFWVSGDSQVLPAHLGARLAIAAAIGVVVLWLCQRVFARLQSNFAQEL